VHILHSAIPVVDQQRVFSLPSPRIRRVILSTNIAKTSVIILDMVFVIDTRKIKEKRFDSERHLSSLVTSWVGMSNINQQAGCAGRHQPGDYYVLLSSRRYKALQIHSTVEIKRTDLFVF
ncbi:P-loop containing nucleoside triphosphate hydrolase protein, partial [Phakopsora pachyrhizi]